jgi:hypothetical protein
MKKKTYLIAILSILLLISLACNLPGRQQPGAEFPPTPNATMTELFALATVLTQAPTDIAANTNTPAVENTATEPPKSILPSNTATPVSPTNTPVPLPTHTPKLTNTPTTPQRSGTFIYAEYLNHAPDMDGDWGEWSTTQYGANTVVWGVANWANGDDLEASYRVGWDEDYLYLAVKVRDDKYVQKAEGADIYKGDSIELLLDANLYGDFSSTVLSPDDYQLGISPGYKTIGLDPEAYLWFPTERTGSKGSVIIGAIQEGDVYRVEFAVPWSLLGTTPYEGQHFGFALSVSDNDDSSANVQQSMVSNAPRRSLLNPTTWRELVLTD